MKNFIIAFILTSLILNCGGGGGGGAGGSSSGGNSGGSGGGDSGGGGGGGDTDDLGDNGGSGGGTDDSTSDGFGGGYPILEADPQFVGNQLKRSGNKYTVNPGARDELVFSSNGRMGYFLNFDQNITSGNKRITPIGFVTDDAIVIATQITKNGGGEPWTFSLDGDWNRTVPKTSHRYYGKYESITPQGISNGVYTMVLNVDYQNIINSVGYDIDTGDEVYITFSSIEDGNIGGRISDQNGDQNIADFGTFGSGARTLAGGYSSAYGSGVFIGVKNN